MSQAGSLFIAHGSIMFKPWLRSIHNEVPAPKCISLEREKCPNF